MTTLSHAWMIMSTGCYSAKFRIVVETISLGCQNQRWTGLSLGCDIPSVFALHSHVRQQP